MLQTRASIEAVAARASVIRYIQGAVLRDPALRQSAVSWWTRQKTVGEWSREDEIVQKTAEKLGCGFVEGVGQAALVPKLRNVAETMLAKVDPDMHAGPAPEHKS